MAEATPLFRLSLWFIAGIVTSTYCSLSASLFLILLTAAILTALALKRHPLFQSLTLGVAIFLLGATLGARQRDEIQASGMSVQQWIKQQKEPDANTITGRSRIYCLHQRDKLLNRYQQHIDGDVYAIVAAMTLGDKSAIDKDLRETYNTSGASHILALSGLHMGIIYIVLTLLTYHCRRHILTQVLIVTALWAYVFLVGMPVSAIRAASMLSIYALLTLGYRERATINILSFTTLLMLIPSPYTLFDISFQMSFLAVLSILVWLPVLDSRTSSTILQRHLPLRWLWGMTAVTLAAQLGVAPLIAFYFGRFSTYFLLTNLIAIPAVTIIVWLALATLLIPPLAPLLTTVTNGLNTWLDAINHLPGASIEGLHPTLLQVILTYLLILCIYWAIYILNSRPAQK